MKKRLLLIPIVAILVLSVFTIPVHAPIIPHEYTLDIPCYAPTKITFNYAYTHNHSISDISTFGSGLYRHSGGPNFYEFIAEQIDDYHFTLEIKYNAPVNQTILVGIWSGTMQMQGLDLDSLFEHILIHVRLRVQTEPTFPTEEEVAQQVVLQVHKDLQEYYTRIDSLMESYNTILMTVSIIAVVAAIAMVISPILNYVVLKQIRPSRG